jgi:prepilin-type processing-associated H-X9-DG protein
MSLMQKRRLDCALVAAMMAIGGGLARSHMQRSNVSPEELLPADSVLYIGWSGIVSQQEAYSRSALRDVVEQSSLGRFLAQVSNAVYRAAGVEGPEPVRELWNELWRHGVVGSLSFSTESKITPVITLVFPGAADRHWTANLNAIIRGLAETSDVKTVEQDGRSLQVIQGRGGEQFAWWVERGHVVVTIMAARGELPVAVAAGRKPNLRSNPAFQEFQSSSAASQPLLQIWGDIRRATSLLIDSQSIDADTLAKLGFDGVRELRYSVAFEGRGLRSELRLDAPSPRQGIVKILLDQPPLTLADLPPLPENCSGFTALGVDLTRTVYDVLDLVKRLGGLTDAQLEEGFAKAEESLGLRIREDLLLALGQRIVIFDCGSQVIPGVGSGIAVEIKDAAVMRRVAQRIAQLIQEGTEGEVQTAEEAVGDVSMFSVDVPPGFPFPIHPTWAVTNRWVVLGLTSEAARSFVECQSGTVQPWKPDAAFAQDRGSIPIQGNWLAWNDPRTTVETLLGVLPSLIEQINQDSGMQLDAALLPSAEQVNQYLFPGHTAMLVDERGMRWVGKSAVPMIGIGSPDTVAVGVVGAAVLLPAVQHARESSRRTQDMNNLKQIGLALHNFHDAYQMFPGGTVDAPDLTPDKRLSWMASILPFLDEPVLFQSFDFKKPWDDPINMARNAQVAAYLNPNMNDTTDANGNGLSHYAGMAGLGADAPALAKNDPRAGVFGYNRKVAIRDITDGTANTIMAMDVNAKLGAWAAGGPSTIRAFTEEPYINGPDGIGGNFAGGANFLFADGSVRFIRENVDPKVLKAMATIAGKD